MNTKRKLFMLFAYEGFVPQGYTLIYRINEMNDEPPYIMYEHWGSGMGREIYEEDGESKIHCLIRNVDAAEFIKDKNGSEKARLGDYHQYQLERSYNDNNLSNNDIDHLTRRINRPAKTKWIHHPPLSSIM